MQREASDKDNDNGRQVADGKRRVIREEKRDEWRGKGGEGKRGK